jgi:hypothetical protein
VEPHLRELGRLHLQHNNHHRPVSGAEKKGWEGVAFPTLMKGASESLAILLAISVLPQPVGPIIRMFLGII